MPENYTEIVNFEWHLDGPKGPDAASTQMNAALDGIDSKITAIGTNASAVFGTSFQASLAPALSSVGELNKALGETLKLLGQIKGIGPINPLGGDGGPPPPPNNPVQPIVPVGGAVSGTTGGFAYNLSGNVANPNRNNITAADFPQVQISTVPPMPPPTPASFSGDMFPATRATGFDQLTNSTSRSRNIISPPSFLAGGISYDAPQEFDTSQWLSANIYNRPALTNYGTGGAPSDQRMGDKWYSKPTLGNMGFMGENDPRYVTQSFDAPKNIDGISLQESQRLSDTIGRIDMPNWLSKLVNQPSRELVPTIDLYRGLGFGKTPDPNATNQWWSGNPNTAVDYNSVGQSNYGRQDQSIQASVLRATADFNLLIDKSMSDYTESSRGVQEIFKRQGMDYDLGGKPEIGAASQMSIGDVARVSSNYKEMLQSATNLPTDQIKATFGYINDATPNIIQLGAAFQSMGGYSKPILNNFGIGGAPSNQRMGDQWSNGLANFGNSYSDLQGQANALGSISDLLNEIAKIRYGGPARDGLIGNEVGFPVETGWTSPIYGGGTVLGGLLNGPQPQVTPGQGSTFGIPNWQTPPQQNVGGNPNSYSYNSANGFYSFGQQDSGPMGPGYGGGGQGAYQYTSPPIGSSATYGPGGYGTPGQPFQFGNGQVFPGAGNPNGFGMAGGLWGPGGGGPAGPPGPPWMAGGWQQGQNNPNFNPAAINMAGNINNVGIEFDNAKDKAGAFESALQRIVVYSVIFAGFAAVGAVIKGVADEMIRFSDVQARVGFINGQSSEATQDQFTQAAQYGIGPDQAGSGILTGAQLGSSPKQQEEAQQLALVFGANQYSRALIELNQTEIRADAVGLKHVSTMDFIAESYKTLPATMADYFNALQMGIQMHGQFGISSESMGLAIERVARTTNQGVGEIGTLYQSVLSKLQTPATQKQLEQDFQIKPGTIDTVLPQVLDTYKQLASVGDTSGIQKLMESIQGGGIGGYARIQSMSVAFKELIAAQESGIPVLAKWDKAFGDISDSNQVKINRLTASWQNFLLALGTGIPGSMVGNFLGDLTSKLNNSANIVERGGQSVRSVSGDPEGAFQRMSQYQKEHPFGVIDFLQSVPGPFPGSNPGRVLEQISGLINAANNNQNGGYNEGGRPGGPAVGTSGIVGGFGLRIPQSILNPYPNPMENFGGLQTMPQQVKLEDYIKMIGDQERQLKIAGVPTDDKNYEVISHSGELLGQILGDSNAIRLTNEKIAQNTSTFGGTPPAGVTAANAAEFQAKVTAEDKKLRDAGITLSDPKTIVFQDKATDALFSIKGTNEGIQFATQKMAMNTPSFAGSLPKGEDIDKIQARISAIDATGMVGKAGLDTSETQKVFWDPVTQTLKSIHGTETAIQIATEEAAKLLQQQITGTFNVPAGGEAVVAFFALQQGFVPAGAGGQGGPNGLGSSATALNGAGSHLYGAAEALINAASWLAGDRSKGPGSISEQNALIQDARNSARGGPPPAQPGQDNFGSQFNQYNQDYINRMHPQGPNSPSGRSVPDASTLGVAGYISAHQGDGTTSVWHPALPQSNIHGQFERSGNRVNPTMSDEDKTYYAYHERIKNMIDNLIGRYPGFSEKGSRTVPVSPTGASARTPNNAASNINVSNAIRINIDGKQIAYYMNRKTYRQFESVRNSVSGVPNSVVTL